MGASVWIGSLKTRFRRSSILQVGIQNMITSFSISRRNFPTRALATCATLASRRSLAKMAAVPGASSAGPVKYMKATDALSFSGSGDVTISGWLGNKIDLCIQNRVMAQDISSVVHPFQKQSDTDNGWRGEFWGKWFTSLVLAFSYQPTPSHRAVIDEAVRCALGGTEFLRRYQ